jgi:predicted RNA-binding protein with PIN domain
LIERAIGNQVENIKEEKPLTKIPISKEVAEIFEKWRRGE